ncbi:MAG: glycosyltransferase family 2 protein [Synergistaceae bacterium]|nr:glycosyltransferase family 2 protein [Synergistaceae bacterium]
MIPTYNRKEFITDAITSVLSQTQKSLEVIVVDDCSTDGTGDFVKGLADERIQYFRNDSNSGQEVSRMNGFRHARGKYVTFMDDDDYYTDYEFFSKAVKIFEEHESDKVPIVMVCANAKVMNMQTNQTRDSNIGRPGRVKGIDYVLGRGYDKPPSTFPAVFRADILRQAGLEDKMIFDTMTYIEAALEGDAWFISDVIGVYRVHGHNHSHGLKDHPADNARHYKIAGENIRRWKHAAEVVQTRTDKHTADSLYIRTMFGLMGFYAVARPEITHRLKTLKCALKVSGFMPKLWLNIPLKFVKHIMNKIRPGKH